MARAEFAEVQPVAPKERKKKRVCAEKKKEKKNEGGYAIIRNRDANSTGRRYYNVVYTLLLLQVATGINKTIKTARNGWWFYYNL